MATAEAKKTRSIHCPVCGLLIESEPGASRGILFGRLNTHLGASHPDYVSTSRFWGRLLGSYFPLGFVAMIILFIGGKNGAPSIVRAGTNSILFIPIIAAYIGLGAFLILLRTRALSDQKRQWTEAQADKISGREVVISPDLARVAMPIQQAAQVQPTETEQRILLLTRNLCERLNIKRFVPDQIAWALSIPMGRTVVLLPSDQFSFIQDNVFVPASLKERMQPEELEPLIASSLINDFVLFRERARKLAVRLLPTLLLIIPMIVAFGVAVAGTFDPVSSTIAGVFGVVLIILTWILNLWQGASIRQKERLKADRQAADTVGHDRFTQSLQKLQSFRLPDIEKREKQGFTTHFSKSPKLSRRIRNLGGP